MNIQTRVINDPSTLVSMGLNPGLVANYLDVSAEPTGFTKESSLGWGTEWCANHTAKSAITGEQIEVDGLVFTVDGSAGGYKKLSKEWKKAREGAE
ncbi:hypothetical protein KPL74_11055 [Bacillus sp. NP157]|nr:hypothetical protein KPL74_11055 [Bacillus sp. NP157]